MWAEDKQFIKQYLITALWSSTDYNNDDAPIDDNYDISDIDLPTIKQAIKDCLRFIELAEKDDLLQYCDNEQAGHDFWLTRNHHGAGFWDGDYPINGDKLTELSEQFGSLDLYITDDNKVSA